MFGFSALFQFVLLHLEKLGKMGNEPIVNDSSWEKYGKFIWKKGI